MRNLFQLEAVSLELELVTRTEISDFIITHHSSAIIYNSSREMHRIFHWD